MNDAAKLVLTLPDQGDKEFVLGQGSVTLGRGATNEIVIHDPKVSRVHARIEHGPGGYTVVDLGSGNGTRVNGERVERADLKPGDAISLGGATLRFELGGVAEDAAEMTQIHSAEELDATLLQTAVPVALSDTHTPHVVVHTSDRTWRVMLEGDALNIGRSADNNVELDFQQVSRHHARIERRGAGFVLKDLGSRNGTWLGAAKVDEAPLQNGETIRIGPAQLVFKTPFDSEDLTIMETHAGDMPSAGRPPVVIVPGLLGSELWQGGSRLWPNVRLIFTQPELFAVPDKQPTEARGLINEVVIVPNLIKLDQYNRLGNFFEETLGYERGNDLREFAYDWRLDVRESAKKLASSIEQWGLKPPIVLVGHSLGTLVCRYYIEKLGGRGKVGRLILMGGMNIGFPKPLTALLSGPNILPFGLMGERLRSALTTFPSLYQAIATYPSGVDQTGKQVNFHQDDSWLAPDKRLLLQGAREFWRDVGTRSSVPTVCIFGYGIKTMTGARIERDGNGLCRKLDLTIEPKGDDSIPERCGVLEGAEIHPVQQYHGSLYVDNDVKMRLKVELTREMG